MKHIIVFEQIYWKCHNCDYLIADLEMKLSRYDYGCPRCKTPFSEFSIVAVSEEKTVDEVDE
jgi:Zn finger protein HypA/HybF involved in hydrogenase expression